MHKKKPLVIFIMGPTGGGKTALAMQLKDNFEVNLISVDSAMVYKGFNIGSAKPDRKTLNDYPHQLVDIIDASCHFSVADFLNLVMPLIQKSHQQGRIPILVGGTMMYFKVLLDGLSELPEKDETLRQQFAKEIEERGLEVLYQKLAEKCPDSAKRINPNDSQRIIRALEVCILSGKPMAKLLEKVKKPLEGLDVLQIALIPKDRAWLHQQVEKRFFQMMDDGLIDEVKALMEDGVTNEMPAMKMIGYKEVGKYLANEYDKKTMIDKAVAASRQLAKRQLTWLRKWPNLHQFSPDEENLLSEVQKLIKLHLQS